MHLAGSRKEFATSFLDGFLDHSLPIKGATFPVCPQGRGWAVYSNVIIPRMRYGCGSLNGFSEFKGLTPRTLHLLCALRHPHIIVPLLRPGIWSFQSRPLFSKGSSSGDYWCADESVIGRSPYAVKSPLRNANRVPDLCPDDLKGFYPYCESVDIVGQLPHHA